MDRLSEVTYEFLSQDGTDFHIHQNHSIPFYPKEPLLYPHLRNFMQFSDTISLDIPKPIKCANNESSPFISDTSSSEDESSNTTYPFNPYNSLNNTSSYNTIIKTIDSNPSHTRIRLPTDSSSHTDTFYDRHAKSLYQLRQQPQKAYRLFLPPSKVLKS